MLIMLYVFGYVWAEIHSLWSDGLLEYLSDLWNLVDFASNSFFLAWIFLRAVAWFIVQVYTIPFVFLFSNDYFYSKRLNVVIEGTMARTESLVSSGRVEHFRSHAAQRGRLWSCHDLQLLENGPRV